MQLIGLEPIYRYPRIRPHGIWIIMDGKGSYRDNLFIEKLLRTVKCVVYFKAYQNGKDVGIWIGKYFLFYKHCTHLKSPVFILWSKKKIDV